MAARTTDSDQCCGWFVTSLSQCVVQSERFGLVWVDLACVCAGDSADLLQERFAKELAGAHTEETLVKFEQLMENAVDLEAVPEEYLIDAGYSADLQVRISVFVWYSSLRTDRVHGSIPEWLVAHHRHLCTVLSISPVLTVVFEFRQTGL